MDWILLAASGIFLPIVSAFQALRLKRIFLRVGESVPFVLLFKTLLVATATNIMAPFKLGTLFTRPFMLKKFYGTSVKKSYVTVAAEQMIESVFEFVVFVSALYFMSASFSNSPLSLIAASLLSIAALSMIFFSTKTIGTADWAMSFLRNRAPARIVGFIRRKKIATREGVLSTLSTIQKKEGKINDFSTIMASSLLLMVCSAVPLYFFLLAMSINISFYQAFFIFWASLFLGKVSGLPGGIGVKEGSMIFMLTQAGVGLAVAVEATIIFRVFSIVIVLILGLVTSAQLGIPTIMRRKKS